MATKDMMEDYCEAIKGVKLSSTPGPRGTRYYDEMRFREFLNRDIDMRDLSQYMADFSQGAEVTQALYIIHHTLQSQIPKKLGYGGTLEQIGSFYDGSKTGRLNEMDCLYVVSESDVVVEEINSSRGQFRVFVKDTEVRPREMNQALIATMEEILSGLSLPQWTHGGYCAPEFSGVRCNGPAVTAMFCNRDENHISLDVSIAFPLNDQLQKAHGFPEQLKDKCQSLIDTVTAIQSEVTRRGIVRGDLHLIGNLVDNTWQPTTALQEAKILRDLDTEGPVRQSVDTCKAISSKQQKWYEDNNTQHERQTAGNNDGVPSKRQPLSGETNRLLTLKNLHDYMEADPDSKGELRDKLNTDMAFTHIWLSATDRKAYKEVLKADASINSAAMKHIVLRTALQMKGAFSGDNKTYRDCLVRTVFEELSDPRSVYTPHAFIHGVELAKFSLSVTLSDIKDDVVRDLQEQCRLILDEGLKKV